MYLFGFFNRKTRPSTLRNWLILNLTKGTIKQGWFQHNGAIPVTSYKNFRIGGLVVGDSRVGGLVVGVHSVSH